MSRKWVVTLLLILGIGLAGCNGLRRKDPQPETPTLPLQASWPDEYDQTP